MKININDIKQLLEKKEAKNQEEQEKKKILMDLFTDENIFFNIKMETAISILDFLGIPEDKLIDTYFSLISSENYQNLPKPYITISKDK